MSKAISFKQFAFNVGAQGAKTREAADPLHKAYTTATAEQKAQLRTDWMVNHINGQGMDGERILSKGKGKGATKAGIAAIDRASSDFRYHIVRPVKTKPASQPKVVVPRAVRTAADVFLKAFDGDNRDAKIDAAIAALRALKS